ncbi:hypothetical protein [Haloglycomyces albus]|uniref:hypothetical protein n=1 Tax=Haloglycomyces albus TaxID=526067 RepID=UPI000557497A|nr:hypothetical protein [Haloglycomyces albus]
MRSLSISTLVSAIVLLFALGVPLFNKAINPSQDVAGESFELGRVEFTAPETALLRPGLFRPEAGQIELTVGRATVNVNAAGPYHYDAEYLAGEVTRLLEARPGVNITEARECVAANDVQGAGSNFVIEDGTGFICAFVEDNVRFEVSVSGDTLDTATVVHIEELMGTLSVKGS